MKKHKSILKATNRDEKKRSWNFGKETIERTERSRQSGVLGGGKVVTAVDQTNQPTNSRTHFAQSRVAYFTVTKWN